LESDEFVLVASLDLSLAFVVVNIKLLIKRIRIIGLLYEVVELVKVWKQKRSYFESLNDDNSFLYDLLLRSIHGSVLGPV
jgi:hypothetical protein